MIFTEEIEKDNQVKEFIQQVIHYRNKEQYEKDGWEVVSTVGYRVTMRKRINTK